MGSRVASLTIRGRLQASFAAIALAAAGIALSNYVQYRRLEGDARAVNLAGSEPVRSYRLAMLAAQHTAFPDATTEEAIEAELARFRAVLVGLRDGGAAEGLKPAPTAEAVAALESGRELFESYELSIRAIVHDADAWARLHGALRDPALRAMNAGLADTASALAERMDRATAELERASAAAVTFYRRLQLALFGLVAAIAVVSFESIRRHVLRPLAALESGLNEVTHGHVGAEVHLGSERAEVARVETAFNAMSRELERVDRMKSDFIATMSHELRTPLTSVIGFAELLGRGIYGPLAERQRDPVERILRNAKALLALLSDILDLAKIEAGKMEVRRQRAPLAPLLEEVAEMFRPLAAAKGVTIATALAPDLPAIETDPARVQQILVNLVSNAVKFTEAGRVTIRATAEADDVRLEVEDTGVGIAASDLHRLFGRFEQIDATPTRRHGGTGLGLHISKRLADLLGGRVEVESEPGRGSRFALILPQKQGEAVPAVEFTRSVNGSTAAGVPREAQPSGESLATGRGPIRSLT